jgi:ATP/maltotriose-dependent transcriptional regulator MalT
VLALVAHGASNREVSARLSLSVATVRKHLEHVYRKLGVCNRTAAVARAFPHSIS